MCYFAFTQKTNSNMRVKTTLPRLNLWVRRVEKFWPLEYNNPARHFLRVRWVTHFVISSGKWKSRSGLLARWRLLFEQWHLIVMTWSMFQVHIRLFLVGCVTSGTHPKSIYHLLHCSTSISWWHSLSRIFGECWVS